MQVYSGQIMYVIHSPYPDGLWRGWEKCLKSDEGGVIVFENETEANELCLTLNPPEEIKYWIVWPIEMDVPLVGKPRTP